ncbi:hypothetical protein FI667_g7764, partial [Globisporangium splendens]
MAASTQLVNQFQSDCSVSPEPVVSVSKDKRVVHCVGNSNGSYQAGVITIDATSQLNGSTGFGSLRDAYIALPYVVTMKNTHGTNALAGTVSKYAVGLNCGVWNVIDSLSVELNGKGIITDNDYKLYWNNLRAMTEWSSIDVVKRGAGAFLAPDDSASVLFAQSSGSAAASAWGDGYLNNTTNVTSTAATGLVPESTGTAPPYNTGFISRLYNNPDQIATSTDGSTLAAANPYGWTTTRSGGIPSMIQQNSKGGFVNTASAAGGIAVTWYHMLNIRLVDLHPIFKELDLVANPQIKIKLGVNQGYVDVTTGASNVMSLAGTTLTSGTTVPIMIASAAAGNPMNDVPHATAGALRVAFGLLQNSLTTLATSGQQKAGTGVSTSQQNVAFSFQLSASLKSIKYVALMPFAETSSGHCANSSANLAQQFASPFDSAPLTCQPGSSVRNFQVQIGNESIFNKTIDYNYESFFDELSKIASVNGGLTHEISNGLTGGAVLVGNRRSRPPTPVEEAAEEPVAAPLDIRLLKDEAVKLLLTRVSLLQQRLDVDRQHHERLEAKVADLSELLNRKMDELMLALADRTFAEPKEVSRKEPQQECKDEPKVESEDESKDLSYRFFIERVEFAAGAELPKRDVTRAFKEWVRAQGGHRHAERDQCRPAHTLPEPQHLQVLPEAAHQGLLRRVRSHESLEDGGGDERALQVVCRSDTLFFWLEYPTCLSVPASAVQFGPAHPRERIPLLGGPRVVRNGMHDQYEHDYAPAIVVTPPRSTTATPTRTAHHYPLGEPMADVVSVNVANAQSLHHAVVNVLARQATERSANTQKQYMNKQKEYREWCASKGFCDGELVYEAKLVDFLDNFVVPRGNKRFKQADGTPQALGFESIDAYVKAIVDLYQQQKSLGMNEESHPRGMALRALVDLLKRSEVTRKREAYADRGVGTVLDGYNVEDMKALSSFWLSQQSGVALRDRVDFLLGHALLARGESRSTVPH